MVADATKNHGFQRPTAFGGSRAEPWPLGRCPGPHQPYPASADATHCAQASTWRSAPIRPTICTPSGSPFGPVPAGTVTHGPCNAVQSRLNIGSPVQDRPFGASPGADGGQQHVQRSHRLRQGALCLVELGQRRIHHLRRLRQAPFQLLPQPGAELVAGGTASPTPGRARSRRSSPRTAPRPGRRMRWAGRNPSRWRRRGTGARRRPAAAPGFPARPCPTPGSGTGRYAGPGPALCPDRRDPAR